MKKRIVLLFTLFGIITQGIAKDVKTIIIRGDDSFPPYEFINDKGEPDGFNIDLTRAVMEELNLPYDLKLGNWGDMLRQLENKEIDLITGIAAVKERGDKCLLSKPHSFINYKFVYREDEPHPNDLKEMQIIVQDHSVPHVKLMSMKHEHTIVVDNMVEGLQLLSEGKGDMAVCSDYMALDIIFKNGLTNLDLVDSHWPVLGYCYSANDPDLLNRIDEAVLKLKRNGIYNRISTKWMGKDKVSYIPIWVYFLMVSLFFTAFLMYFFVRIYKKRAQRSERLLRQEYEKLNTLYIENQLLIKRYHAIFNSTLIGFSFYDKHGILININDMMFKLYRADDKEKLLEEKISIYDNLFLYEYGIIDVNNHIHEFHGLVKYDMRDGHFPKHFTRFATQKEVIYLRMDVFPIKDDKGELDGILITAIDQTLEVNYKQRMKEEEDKLNMVLDAGRIAAWTYDPQTEIFSTIRGNALAGTGLTMEKCKEILHPDDREWHKDMFGALINGEKEIAEITPRFINEDGTYHYYETLMITRKENEKVVTILGTQKDVTEDILNTNLLNNTVKKLYFAIQTAGMSMWEYDCKTNMFATFNEPMTNFVNGALISMDDYGRFFEEGTHWEGLQEAKRIMYNGINESYSFQVKTKTDYDSDWQYYIVRGVPLEKDENDRVIKYLGIRENITEQVNYQEMLLNDKESALQADKLKSAFLANMSHEIRTPLNAIVGFSELLMVEADEAERADYMNIISKNNEQLLHLIGDILDLSKIESGFIELKPSEFDLSEVFKDTFSAMKQRCTNPEIRFLAHNPYESLKVNLDKDRLLQVGMNFATNAIKHTSCGHILMGYDYVDEGVKIFVQDTGRGISRNKQDKLFQRFSKLDDFTQGTGLGLAICKAIIDAQDGRIGVESEEGQGSTFWAWFPCKSVSYIKKRSTVTE